MFLKAGRDGISGYSETLQSSTPALFLTASLAGGVRVGVVLWSFFAASPQALEA